MRTRFDAPRTLPEVIDRRIQVCARRLRLSHALIPTLCVSPPRSGHHLLTNYLFKYFSRNPEFQDLAGHETNRRARDVVVAGPLRYCEYYHHCRRIPCVDPRVNLMKFHDRIDREPADRFAHIIVQLRNPLLSVRSFFTFRHRRAPKDADELVEMLRDEIGSWRSFVEKWAIAPHRSRLLILYDDLMTAPGDTLERTIHFVQPGRSVDMVLLRRCIDSQRVIRNDWVAHQGGLWRDARLADAERQIAPLLEQVGIRRLFP